MMEWSGWRAPASLIVLGHAALAIALFATDGHESLIGVLFVIAMIVAWVKALRGMMHGVTPGVDGAVVPVWYVALGSALLSLLVFIKPPGLYLQATVAPFLVLDGVAALVLATYWLDVVALRSLPKWVVVGRRAVLFLLALAIGAWMLRASPNPKIDLFPVHQQAAEAILAGKSIYEPGVIHTIETFHNKDTLDAYTYLPFGACLTTVAYVLTHDIRWADLVAQLAGASLLWVVARRMAPEGASPRRAAWADLIALTFLYHPRGPFVLEEAWTEPLAIPFLGGFVLLVLARRPMLASVCLGFFFAMKQHLFLYAPYLALVPGVGIAGLAVAGVVAVATIIPFAIPSPYNLYRGAFAVLIRNPFRYDALSIPAELYRIGIVLPTWVGFLAGLAPIAWLRRMPRTLPVLLLAASVSFSLFYVLGRQAFCNYYYLLDVTVLFGAATLGE
ncbi:MAG: hypothetical protein ACLQVI_05310 [Polyangiaceae bacterium]